MNFYDNIGTNNTIIVNTFVWNCCPDMSFYGIFAKTNMQKETFEKNLCEMFSNFTSEY